MNITIKKIAEIAGVSRGTVDRVIHDRPGVKDDIREKVSNILEALDYRPNLAGKALVSTNRNISIGVVLAPDFNPFVEEVKKGIDDEARRIGAYGVTLDVEVIRAFDVEEQLEVMNRLQAKGVSAIAIVPIRKPPIIEKINELTQAGIPVVTFNSDAAESRRLCFVGQDNYKAGRTAGDLAAKLVPYSASAAIITSTGNLSCHTERAAGFRQMLSESGRLYVAAVEENQDMDEAAYDITLEYISRISDLKLIYITGGGAAGVGRALKKCGAVGCINVVAHDLIPECVVLLNEGVVDFVIGQNPYMQGLMPLKILFNNIFLKEQPGRDIFYTGVDIFTRENIG